MLDDHGHGTQVASVAAGNAAVSVDVPGQPEGRFSGVAPRARIAAYKACWTAPDPDDDGCATADLVAAVDRAVHDRVDVLVLAVAGSEPGEALERALLGAAESGVVVVAAAGNDGRTSYAAHESPWVTTVGATTGPVRTGRLVLPGGPTVTGAMAATRGRHDVRLVAGADAVAEGASRAAARQCRDGALDAARVRGAVVLCERGGTARVAKSAAVRRADGVAMVLVNTRPGAVVADLHVVPTVHLRQDDGAAVAAWLRRHPQGRVDLLPDRSTPTGSARQARVPAWSEPGDPSGAVLKPDLVATGTGVLAASPPSVRGLRWDLVGGTSVASARVAGLAASLLARHDWSAAEVRSALATTAAPVAATSLRAGAGRAGSRARGCAGARLPGGAGRLPGVVRRLRAPGQHPLGAALRHRRPRRAHGREPRLAAGLVVGPRPSASTTTGRGPAGVVHAAPGRAGAGADPRRAPRRRRPPARRRLRRVARHRRLGRADPGRAGALSGSARRSLRRPTADVPQCPTRHIGVTGTHGCGPKLRYTTVGFTAWAVNLTDPYPSPRSRVDTSRISTLRTLPVTVIGNSSTTVT